MKKALTTRTFLLGLIAFFFFMVGMSNLALATVGGPTTVSKLTYDAAEHKVYYLETDGGGAGFGPSLIEYDPASQDFSTISIDPYLLERLDEEERKNIRFTDSAEVENFLAGLDPLPRIDLVKNSVYVDISFAEEYDVSYSNLWYGYLPMELVVQILQHGNIIGGISFYDCGDRIILEGYLVPNTTQLLVFTSNVGICFESGYSVDRVVSTSGFVVEDATVLPGSLDMREEREWPAGTIAQREGSVAASTAIPVEEKYTQLQSFANDAYKEGELEAAAEYLGAIWVHCCFSKEQITEAFYDIAFEWAAIQSERGKVDRYGGAVSILENLFKRLDAEERDSYTQKLLADARFTQLRDELSQEQFNALISAVEIPEETATEGQEPEAPAQQEESADEPETRQEESISFVMPAVIISVFLVGAILIFVIRKRKRSSPNTGHSL